MKHLLISLLLLLSLDGCLDLEPPTHNGHQSRTNYAEIRPVFWGTVYASGGETLYCGEKFGSRHGGDINIEHIFPMSWVTKSLQCGEREECRNNSDRFNQIEADMHNLYPALADINYARSSMAFAILDGEDHYQPGCDFEIDKRRYLAEPRSAARGEIARAMLYMANTYPELKLYRRQRELLEQWHRQDPPSDEERRRNRLIMQVQGTGNSLIE